MKLLINAALTLFLGVVMATTAHGQNLRIVYVNMKEVLDTAPQVIAGREKLDIEFRDRNDAIEADEVRIAGMEERLSDSTITDAARSRLEREVRELRRGINRRREDLRDEFSLLRTEEVQQL